MENGDSELRLKAMEALRRIEHTLYQLQPPKKLNSREDKRLKEDVNLVKGRRSANSKRMEPKLKEYKAFLTKCIVSEKLGPSIMLICSVALGLKRVYELYHIGREILIELIIKRKLETQFLHDMVQDYEVPGRDFFESPAMDESPAINVPPAMNVPPPTNEPTAMNHQPMQFLNTCSPGSELSASLCRVLSSVNAEINLTLPLDPRAIPQVTLTMDLNDEVAWKIATLLSISG